MQGDSKNEKDKFMRKVYCLFLILAGVAMSLSAQEPLILTEDLAVSLALGQNLSLKSSLLDLESSQESNENSWNVFLPDFTVSGGTTRSEELFTVDSSQDDDSWTVWGSVDASLTLNYAAIQAMDADQLSYDSQSLSYETAKNQLISSVRKQFYYLLANKENLELVKKNLDLAEKRYIQTKTNFENGLASELSVLESRNSYESIRPSYTNTKTSYETQLMSFKNLLGLDLNQEIDVTGSLDTPVLDLDASSLINKFMAKRLDVQSAVKNLDIQENLKEATNFSKRTPSISLSGDWSNYTYDTSDLDWNDAVSLTLSLSLPLNGFIPGSEDTLEINDTAREVEQARLQLQEIMDSAEQDIHTLVMQLEGYLENIEITAFSVELAQRTYEMTESAYEFGTKELLDLEDAQNKLLSANEDLLQSRYSYLSGLIDLEYALNSTLDEIQGEL
jgi:outer membrane protein TolC